MGLAQARDEELPPFGDTDAVVEVQAYSQQDVGQK